MRIRMIGPLLCGGIFLLATVTLGHAQGGAASAGGETGTASSKALIAGGTQTKPKVKSETGLATKSGPAEGGQSGK